MLAKGVDEVIAITVNDPFVVTKFAESLGSEHIHFMADGNCEFATACDLTTDLSGAFLATRSKRFSMVIRDGQAVHFNNEDGPGFTEISSANNVLS